MNSYFPRLNQNLKKYYKTIVLFIAISGTVCFSSCSADDIEMPLKKEAVNENYFQKNDTIPPNDKDNEIDPPPIVIIVPKK